jgi:hypothetical protein
MSDVKYSQVLDDYDKFYSNQHCHDENRAIEEILHTHCRRADKILDIGAGTGLVSKLLGFKCDVLKIDNDMEFCLKYGAMNFDAYTFLKILGSMDRESIECFNFNVITSTFSINYMHPLTILKILEVINNKAVIVMYHKPYLKGSSSFYAGKRFFFMRKHFLKQLVINALIKMKSKFVKEDFLLLGEPYYRVIVLEKRG